LIERGPNSAANSPDARPRRGGAPAKPWRSSIAVAAVLLLVAACSALEPSRGDVRHITIVTISDWHGQLEPLIVDVGGGATRPVGGAAALKAYFDAERRRNPNGTLVVTAGDAFGATPPLSSFLEDVPAVEAASAMGVQVDTLGNHNFDHGVERVRALMARARFPYVVANVVDADGRTFAPPSTIVTLDGVRVGFIGIAQPETPELVAPGRTGGWRFLAPAAVVNAHARALRAAGAEIVVVLAHMGAVSVGADGVPVGPAIELARASESVDVLVADHTDVTVNATIDGVLVVENRSKGAEYAVIDLDYDRAAGAVVAKRAVHRRPWADTITPDATVQALIDGFRARVRPLFDEKIGEAALVLDRSRAGESLLGNFETDALRAAYGTDVAFDTSGGLRDDLPSSYRPADRALRRPTAGYAAGPPWDLVRGDLVAIFPFGNVAVTLRVSGRTLWQVLEHSVSEGRVRDGVYTNRFGRFLQISGFRYVFDPRRAPGARVIAVSRLDGRAIPADDATYSAVTSEFLTGGGDGYTMLKSAGAVTREPIADVVARAVAGGLVRARRDGRITGVLD
jgi:5'-nucleotidase